MFLKMVTKTFLILLPILIEIVLCVDLTIRSPHWAENENTEFPWIVFIKNSFKETLALGTLIHSKVVLTSAVMEQCFEKQEQIRPFDFMVLAGCNLVEEDYEYCDYTSKEVESCSTFTENFEYVTYLAVLILTEPFRLSNSIEVFPLFRDESDNDYDKCFIVMLQESPNFPVLTSINFNSKIDPQVTIENEINRNGDENLQKMKLSGAPIVCLRKSDKKLWLLGVVDEVEIENGKDTSVDITYVNDLIDVIDKIIDNSLLRL